MNSLQKLNVFQINLMHILLIGPLLYYIGNNGSKNDESVYYYIITMIILMPFMVGFPSLKFESTRDYINTVHLTVFTYLGYLIYKKKNSLPEYAFEFIKYAGICTVAVHIYLAYEKYKNYF